MGGNSTIAREYAVTLSAKTPNEGGSGWIRDSFTIEVRASTPVEALSRIGEAGIALDRFDVDTIDRIKD